ncbi:MAG TPA: hypothetical protein VJB96_03760 [Patescibacteria group bacterium]|nr:hypothetical protein [Patescibacteria group bacterium]
MSNEVINRKYLHKNNTEQPYLALGFASRINSLDEQAGQVTDIGVALGVAGYEETGQVSGEQIRVVQVEQDGKPQLYYIMLGEFEIPDVVVTYKQLKSGSYPSGQLWCALMKIFKNTLR